MPRVAEAPPVAGLKAAWDARLDDHVIAIAWSPDGSRLAAASVSGPISLFSGIDGARVLDLPGHRHGTMAISWSADGTLLASGGQDGKARLWNGVTGEMVAEVDGGAQWVECVAFSPVKQFLATAAGRKLRLWDATGNLLLEYPDHPSTITDIQWQPNQLFFATAAYGRLSTFRCETPVPAKEFAWKGSILRIAWSPDGNHVATGNQDATVHFWYRKSGKDLEMSGYPAKVRELAWDSGGRFLATGGSPVVTIWDCSGKGPAGSRPIELKGHYELISALAYQHKGPLLASGGRDGRVGIWNPSKSTRHVSGVELKSAVTQLAWSRDDTRLAAANEGGQVIVFLPEAK